MQFVLFWNSFFKPFIFRFVWFPLFFKRTFHCYFSWRRFRILKWNLLNLGLNSSIHNLTPMLTRRVATFYKRIRWNTFLGCVIWLANWLLLRNSHLFNLSFPSVWNCRFFSPLLHLNRLDYSCLKNIHVTFYFVNFLKFEVLYAQVGLLLRKCRFSTILISILFKLFSTTLNGLMNLIERWK